MTCAKKHTVKKTVSANLQKTTIRRKPSASTKPALYQLFFECSQYTLDPYWQQVFEECSRGKFPKGSGINVDRTIIRFNRDNNYFTYKLKKSPEQVFQDLKKLFQEQLNLKSNQDRQEIRDELDDICRNLQETFTGSWQKIKRKKIKDPIIRRYILDLKEKYDLNDKETAEVSQIIKLGFLFNWIANDKVKYKNQLILNITILHFNKKDRSFELEEPDVNYKREYKPKRIRLSSLWMKHLGQPKNRYVL